MAKVLIWRAFSGKFGWKWPSMLEFLLIVTVALLTRWMH
jgi:hypothetical protein